jgi:hypothetical protein
LAANVLQPFTWFATWQEAGAAQNLHNVLVHTEPEPKRHTPVWRDPLSAGWRAHRGLLMLRLRWHERREAPAERPQP